MNGGVRWSCRVDGWWSGKGWIEEYGLMLVDALAGLDGDCNLVDNH